jgi:hypothetical protein
MAPITDFAVEEKYEYLNGFGNHHQFVIRIPFTNATKTNLSPQGRRHFPALFLLSTTTH